ncbi:MAG: response regulator transcription factor [Bacteroidales bacterium]|nr:response regulator transcription factor [Bacteroidales bacterium]
MKAIIVDDSTSIRKNLELYLQTELNIEVLASFNSGSDFLNYAYSHYADFILMDISMPGIDGLQTAKQYLWNFPMQKIIAVTMYHDKAYLKQLIEVGIKGCVFKDQIYSDLKMAIKMVLKNSLYFPEELDIE